MCDIESILCLLMYGETLGVSFALLSPYVSIICSGNAWWIKFASRFPSKCLLYENFIPRKCHTVPMKSTYVSSIILFSNKYLSSLVLLKWMNSSTYIPGFTVFWRSGLLTNLHELFVVGSKPHIFRKYATLMNQSIGLRYRSNIVLFRRQYVLGFKLGKPASSISMYCSFWGSVAFQKACFVSLFCSVILWLTESETMNLSSIIDRIGT